MVKLRGSTVTVTTVNANMVMDPPANTGSATEKEEEEE